MKSSLKPIRLGTLILTILSVACVLILVRNQSEAPPAATTTQQTQSSGTTSRPHVHAMENCQCGAPVTPARSSSSLAPTETISSAPVLALRQSAPGSTITISLLGQSFQGKILLNKAADAHGNWLMKLKLPQLENATFSLSQDQRHGLSGMIMNASGSVAYKISSTGDQSQLLITPCDVQNLICGTNPEVGLPGTHAITQESSGEDGDPSTNPPSTTAPTAQTLDLQSLPGSPNVLYLDFDGEVVVDTGWNDGPGLEFAINAAASHFYTDTDIRLIWQAVAQDFSPFNVNVTTSRAAYDATPITNRMMQIFTESSEWYGRASGVAFSNSFGSSDRWCCWTFTDTTSSASYKADTCSHEFGHTLGLSHDGYNHPLYPTEYHSGHGGNHLYSDWRPIMGTFGRAFVTWDNGGYLYANRTENDLAIMESYLGSLSDENPGIIPLPIKPDKSVAFNASFRLTTTNTPEASDDYQFYSAGGPITLTAVNAPLSFTEAEWGTHLLNRSSNLDLKLQILDSNNQVVLTDQGDGKRTATCTGTLPEGLFKVKVLTTNVPEPTYYSTYGQLGIYSIVGSVPVISSIVSSPPHLSLATTSNANPPADSIQLSATAINDSLFSVESSATWLSVTANPSAFVNSQASLSLSYNISGLQPGTHVANIKVISPGAAQPLYIPITLEVSTPANSSLTTIPNLGTAEPYPSSINLGSLPGTIKSTIVRFNGFQHGRPNDLRALLVSPAGKKVMLCDNKGGTTSVSSPINFSFEASGLTLRTSLTNNARYRPSGLASGRSNMPSPAPASPYESTFSPLVNDPIAGTWSLYLADATDSFSGSLAGWSIEFTLNSNDLLVVSSYLKGASENHQIQFTTNPGKLYSIEASDTLGNWTEVRRITATTAETTVIFNQEEKARQFYRIRLVP